VSAERHGWSTLAPAKVNLDLRLHGRRADGYHLLSTVLQSLALADRLTLRPADGPFSLSCDVPGVPLDATNLAWRGARAMADALGVPLDGWALHLEKHVPAEAGLGGGSSDAAAAARLVAASVDAVVDPGRLADLVRPLGADVAFFAWGGTVRGEGVGDVLTPLPDAPAATVVLVRPPFGVPTRDAYAWYDADVLERTSEAPAGAAPQNAAYGDAQWATYGNDLEAPVAARHPEIALIVTRLRDGGARCAAMSGSGSACFALFEDEADAAAMAGWAWPAGTRVWTTSLLPRAAYAEATRCHRVGHA